MVTSWVVLGSCLYAVLSCVDGEVFSHARWASFSYSQNKLAIRALIWSILKFQFLTHSIDFSISRFSRPDFGRFSGFQNLHKSFLRPWKRGCLSNFRWIWANPSTFGLGWKTTLQPVCANVLYLDGWICSFGNKGLKLCSIRIHMSGLLRRLRTCFSRWFWSKLVFRISGFFPTSFRIRSRGILSFKLLSFERTHNDAYLFGWDLNLATCPLCQPARH